MKKLSVAAVLFGVIAVMISVLLLSDLFSAPRQETVPELPSVCPRTLDITTIASDILIEQGDSFRVEYRLSGKERVGRLAFSDDAFVFSAAGKLFGIPSFKESYVKVTAPESFVFSSVSLKTVSGKISLTGRSVVSFDEGRFETIAGDCLLNETAFRNAAVETVSGRIEANPQVSESCTLKTVSGAVDICLKEKVSVEAESYGSVSVYGNDFGNRAVIRLSDSPVIAAESVSGRITVRTANDESPSRDSRQP